MTNPKNVTSRKSSNGSVDPISMGVDSPGSLKKKDGRSETPDIDREMREAVSKDLHELLNSLWPAAVRIELAITEDSCPAKLRETLEQFGRCVEEAMTIAARASERVGSSNSKHVGS